MKTKKTSFRRYMTGKPSRVSSVQVSEALASVDAGRATLKEAARSIGISAQQLWQIRRGSCKRLQDGPNTFGRVESRKAA